MHLRNYLVLSCNKLEDPMMLDPYYFWFFYKYLHESNPLGLVTNLFIEVSDFHQKLYQLYQTY